MLKALVLRSGAAVLPHVPEAVGYPLFGRLGDAGYLLAPRWRRLVTGNLRRAVGDEVGTREGRRRARLAFRNLLWGYYELFRHPVRTERDLRTRGTIEGIAHLHTATSGPTGCVIGFAHLGNLEVLAQLPLLYPTHRFVVVIERMDDPRIHTLIRDLRASRGLPTVPTDEPRRIMDLLRGGTHVIIALDYDSTDRGLVTDLFGRPAQLPKGAVKMALRTGAPLLPVEGWRVSMDDPARFRVRVHPPLDLRWLGEEPDDVRAGVDRLVPVLERMISARPEQWLAFRDVWLPRTEMVSGTRPG